jgi:exopolysaccharide production protein ExoY
MTIETRHGEQSRWWQAAVRLQDQPASARLGGAGTAPLAAPKALQTLPPAIRRPGRPLGGVLKRAVDIVLAGGLLVLLAPLMLGLALAIRLTSGGPVVFAQPRVGFNGRTFKCLKFRTMVADARTALEQHLADNPEAAREWAETQKLRADPRVTRLGRFLRKSSLDELPQLFNVLIGDMSCVGPRPVVTDEIKRYGANAAYYMAARPGITGLWQTSGRNSTTYAERVDFDTEYASRWSLWLDLKILAATIPAVLSFDTTS